MEKLSEKSITYKNPKFYFGEYRNQFEIIDKIKINTLPTLENIKDYYELHMFSDGYIGCFNNIRKQYIKPHIGDDRSPYFRYGLMTIDNKSKTTYMHRLVGLAFVDGWKIGKMIDHKDTDELNNLISNLEWVTGKENTQRAVKKGLGVGRPRVFRIKKKKTRIQISESSSKGRNGLTFEQVGEIMSLFDSGMSVTSIAKEFGVTQPAISQILQGKRWKDHPARGLYDFALEAV